MKALFGNLVKKNNRRKCHTKFTNIILLDRWVDNAMDTKQVIEEMGLDQGYDQLIGVGHSFGATSMYNVYNNYFVTLY